MTLRVLHSSQRYKVFRKLSFLRCPHLLSKYPIQTHSQITCFICEFPCSSPPLFSLSLPLFNNHGVRAPRVQYPTISPNGRAHLRHQVNLQDVVRDSGTRILFVLLSRPNILSLSLFLLPPYNGCFELHYYAPNIAFGSYSRCSETNVNDY